jgi:uncharacterized protein (UPF0332 family)
MIEKAEESLQGASILAREKMYAFAVSRAYYAVFYSAEAALITKNLMSSSHKSIITLFNREFIRTKLLPQEIYKVINNLNNERQSADYYYFASYTSEECEECIVQATSFVDAVRTYIIQGGFLPPTS